MRDNKFYPYFYYHTVVTPARYIINQLNPECDNVTTEYQTLWRGRGKRVLCDTAGVGELCRCLSTGSPFGHHPRLRMVCPRRGRWMSTQYGSEIWIQ